MNTPDEIPEGVTTIFVPLSTEARRLLGECRAEAERREPGQQPESDTLYAGILLEHAIRKAHATLFPKMIIDPYERRR
jgi:hypothetical protein